MTLSFSTHINGQPTLFPEKIWNGIWDDFAPAYWDFYAKELSRRNAALHEGPANLKSKIHTIRADPHDRWKPGMDIHFVINNRTPKRFQFAPILQVKSIQKIDIIWSSDIWDHKDGVVGVLIDKKPFAMISFMNGEVDTDDDIVDDIVNMTSLAVNDGFDGLNEFFHFFDRDFSGKIIHWTDEKY